MRSMIRADEALALVLEHAHERALPAGEIPASASLGLHLARPILADRDYPPFDRSIMDGFAVRVAHAGRTVAIRGEARPGIPSTSGPDDETCLEIMTGAPCPPGTEAVVMKEQVERGLAFATFPAAIVPGQNIVRAGTECRVGDVVLPAGARVTPIALGLLASVGQRSVWAGRRPSLTLLITGDELAADGARPGDVEIRDSNGPTLAAMARGAGIDPRAIVSVRDTREALAAALESSRTSDVVVLTGGVSAGNYDLVPGALEALGATVVFHKVRQQPGKPILFAVKGAQLLFGLPGTPLGCHLGFHRYVLPALRALAGRDATLPEERGVMAAAWSTTSDRQQFVLARAERREAAWSVTPLAPKGSSDLFTAWAANAYLPIPEGTRRLDVGAEVPFEWLEAKA